MLAVIVEGIMEDLPHVDWATLLLGLLLGIPVAYVIGILTHMHGIRLERFFENRDLLKKRKTREQALARISHTIFARSSKVERGFVSFCGDVLARSVGRRERELGFFRSCGCSEQFDLSVGLR